MCIWSILLIKSDLNWCIHLSRRLYLYFNYLVSVAAKLDLALQIEVGDLGYRRFERAKVLYGDNTSSSGMEWTLLVLQRMS